ncbi:MAG: hypothetical protein RL112_810 [Planctomycetota bacterium]|jgi:hypothetical protein
MRHQLSLTRTTIAARIAALLAFAALAAPTSAQKKPPVEAPSLAPHVGDLDSARALAKERNAPLLIHMVLDGESDNDAYRDKLLADAELVKLSLQAVVVVANNGTHKKKSIEVKSEEKDGKPAKREACESYPMYDSCAKHQRNWNELYGLYKEDSGDLRCPQAILLLPDGKQHERWHDGTVPAADDIRGALAEAIKLAGPGLTLEQLEAVKKLAAEARATESSDDVATWRAWSGVLAVSARGKWADEAVAGRDAAFGRIQARTRQLQAQLAPGTVVAASRALRQLAKDLAGTPLEKEILQSLKKAESQKELKDELAKARLEEEADLLLKEAETAADLGDPKKAEKAARKLFAKKYRETGAARVGRERWPDLAREIEEAEQGRK